LEQQRNNHGGGQGLTEAQLQAIIQGATIQPAQLQALLEAATTAALQANAPPAAQAAPFAYTPVQAIQGVIDFNTKTGGLAYKEATAPLTVTFALEATLPDIKGLQTDLADRSRECGWNSLFEWNVQGPPARTVHILTGFRNITKAEVDAHVATYLGQHNRMDQDDQMLLKCLKASVTDDTKLSMENRASTFRVEVNHVPVASGVLYLYVLLTSRKVNNNEVVRIHRLKLHHLTKTMKERKDNIIDFNESVKEIIKVLVECGETYPEACPCIFEAYLSVNCFEFHRKIKKSAGKT